MVIFGCPPKIVKFQPQLLKQRDCNMYLYRKETSHQNRQKKPCPYFSVGPNLGKIHIGVARVESKNSVT